jgi:tetratricopeptide (TPR) repeat protein
VAVAKALSEAWLNDAGLPIAEQAVKDARALGYKPLEAAALFVLARLQDGLDKMSAESERNLQAAEIAAELGGDPLIRVRALAGLSILAWRHGAQARGRQMVEDACTLARELGDPETRWRAQNVRALMLTRLSESEQSNRELVTLAETAFGRQSGLVGLALYHLAINLHSRGAFQEALETAERAVRTFMESFGPNYPKTNYALNQQAFALVVLGRFAEASAAQDRVMTSLRQDGDVALLVPPLVYYTEANLMKERWTEALDAGQQALQALAIRRSNGEYEEWEVLTLVGWCLLKAGRPSEAEYMLRRAELALGREADKPPSFSDMAGMRPLALGELALLQGRSGDAVPLLERGLRDLAASDAETEPDLLARAVEAETHFALARALATTSPTDAREHAQRARAAYQTLAPFKLELVTTASGELEAWIGQEHLLP